MAMERCTSMGHGDAYRVGDCDHGAGLCRCRHSCTGSGCSKHARGAFTSHARAVVLAGTKHRTAAPCRHRLLGSELPSTRRISSEGSLCKLNVVGPCVPVVHGQECGAAKSESLWKQRCLHVAETRPSHVTSHTCVRCTDQATLPVAALKAIAATGFAVALLGQLKHSRLSYALTS
eukprot:1246302-Amphidinium_carterae.1